MIPNALLVYSIQTDFMFSKLDLEYRTLKTDEFSIYIPSRRVNDFLFISSCCAGCCYSYFLSMFDIIVFILLRNSLTILFKMWKSKLNFLLIFDKKPAMID